MHLRAFKPFPLGWMQRQGDLYVGRKTRGGRSATTAKTFKVFCRSSTPSLHSAALWVTAQLEAVRRWATEGRARCRKDVMSCLSCKCDCETASARVRKVCVRTKNTKLTVVAGTELGRSPFIIYNYLYGPKAGWVKKKTKACYSCCCSDTHKKI